MSTDTSSREHQDPPGVLEVTVRFDLSVSDLTHYEATTLGEAATNLSGWYADGSADILTDMCSGNIDIDVRVKQ